MAKIKFGWAEESIMPNKKIKLAGQFYERVSNGVDTEITVTAFAVESGDDQMIICSCDLGGIGVSLNRQVKEMLKDKLPISVDKVIISATHTHASHVYTQSNELYGPHLSGNSLQYLSKLMPEDMKYVPHVSSEDCMNPNDARDLIANAIVTAVLKAWENRSEGLYQNAFGRAVIGMNRRVCFDDGSAAMWGDTNSANFEMLESGNDSGIELIYIYDTNKNLTGVVANVACPSQVMEHRNLISADYWGQLKLYLDKKFGRKIFVLGLCSAAGDQCPRDMIRWVNGETPVDDPNIERLDYIERRADPSMFDLSGLKVVGRRLANEVIGVYEDLGDDFKDEGILVHETFTLKMPLRRVTKKEYNESVEKIQNFIDKNKGKNINYRDNARLHIYAGNAVRYELQHTTDTYDNEIHIVRFGDIAIATNPYELFLDYGNRIRARSRAKQTILIQLACGSFGYLPTERAENGSHYSAYVSSGYTGHIGGDLLVRETVSRINKKFEE
ncbi:MAG: hypothetical protein E7358_02170 [Clostridiales bacterium]|nr:hypothetical protein [Clostridiales bacterium]